MIIPINPVFGISDRRKAPPKPTKPEPQRPLGQRVLVNMPGGERVGVIEQRPVFLFNQFYWIRIDGELEKVDEKHIIKTLSTERN